MLNINLTAVPGISGVLPHKSLNISLVVQGPVVHQETQVVQLVPALVLFNFFPTWWWVLHQHPNLALVQALAPHH